MKQFLVFQIIFSTALFASPCSSIHFDARTKLVCESNELKKQQIKAIKEQTKVLEEILKQMKKNK